MRKALSNKMVYSDLLIKIKQQVRSLLAMAGKFYQFYVDSSVQQLVGLKDELTDSLQQVVALSHSDSVEQPIKLNPIILVS